MLALEDADSEGDDEADVMARGVDDSRRAVATALVPLEDRRTLLQHMPARATRSGRVPLEPCLQLTYGCQVMLQRNLATPLGAVNGALGTVVGFVYFTDQRPTAQSLTATLEQAALHPPPLPTVLVRLNRYNGRTCPLAPGGNVVPICPMECSVRVNRQTYVRMQLPLRVAKATTIHKAQGQSLESVCIDTRHMFSRAMAYVAVSRARNYARLHLLHANFGIKAFQSTSAANVEREYTRLRALRANAAPVVALATLTNAQRSLDVIMSVAPPSATTAPGLTPAAVRPPATMTVQPDRATTAAPPAASTHDAALQLQLEERIVVRAELERVAGGVAAGVAGDAADASARVASTAAAATTNHVCDARPVDVLIPTNPVLLRNTAAMTLAVMAARLESRQHSCVYMAVICAAVNRAHENIALIVALVGTAWWNRIVAAAAVSIHARQPIQWSNAQQTYAAAAEQERLLAGMDVDAAQDLRLFCASLPSSRECNAYLTRFVVELRRLRATQPPAQQLGER